MLAGQPHGLHHIFNAGGNHHSDRDLTIVGTVSSIEGAATVIKTDFASNGPAQVLRESVSPVARELLIWRLAQARMKLEIVDHCFMTRAAPICKGNIRNILLGTAVAQSS